MRWKLLSYPITGEVYISIYYHWRGVYFYSSHHQGNPHMVGIVLDGFLAPLGALVVVVFLDISMPSQAVRLTYRFECSQLFYVKLWSQVEPSVSSAHHQRIIITLAAHHHCISIAPSLHHSSVSHKSVPKKENLLEFLGVSGDSMIPLLDLTKCTIPFSNFLKSHQV